MSEADALTLYAKAIQDLTDATVTESFNLDRWRYANSQAWFAYDDLSPTEQDGVERPDSVRIALARQDRPPTFNVTPRP